MKKRIIVMVFLICCLVGFSSISSRYIKMEIREYTRRQLLAYSLGYIYALTDKSYEEGKELIINTINEQYNINEAKK